MEQLARQVKEQFDLEFVTVYGLDQVKGLVSRVAVSPGAGGSMLNLGIASGAKAMVTGDIGHHGGIDAAAQGMAVIDAGHYGLEHIFMPFMKGYLENVLGPEGVVMTARETKPVRAMV